MKTLELFREESSDPKRDAQLNLAGRTHWADDDTLRFFHCRILSSRCYAEGRLFYVLYSAAQDMGNTSRGYGFAIFAIDGQHDAGTTLPEDRFSTKAQARKALTKALATIEPDKSVEDAIARVHKDMAREEQFLREALARLAAKRVQAAIDAEG